MLFAEYFILVIEILSESKNIHPYEKNNDFLKKTV